MTEVAGGVILVALVTTIVAHKNTSDQIRAAGSAATSLLRTAMGQKNSGGY